MTKKQLCLCIVWLLADAVAQDIRNQLAPIPDTGFVCSGKIAGFYADPHPAVNCRVYHLCNFRGGKASFTCPNGTAFHQQFLICAHAHEVNCSMATKFYHVNNNVFPVTKSPFKILPSTVSSATLNPFQNSQQQTRPTLGGAVQNQQNFIQRTPITIPTSFLPRVTVSFRNDLNTIQQTPTTVKPLLPRATVRNDFIPIQPLRTAITTPKPPFLSRVTAPFRNDFNSIEPTRSGVITPRPLFSTASARQPQTFVTTQRSTATTRAAVPIRNDQTRVVTPRTIFSSATATIRNDQNTIAQDDPLDELLVPSPARRRHLSTPTSTNQQTPQQQRQNFVTTSRRFDVQSPTLSVQANPKLNNPFFRQPSQSVTPSTQQISTLRTTKTEIPPSKRLPVPPAMIDMLEKQMREQVSPVTTSRSNISTRRDLSTTANRWRLPVNRQEPTGISPTTQLPSRTTPIIHRPHQPFETPIRKLPLNLLLQRQPSVFNPQQSDKNSFTEKYEEFKTTIDPNSIGAVTAIPNAAFGTRQRANNNWTPARDTGLHSSSIADSSSVPKNFLPAEEWESHLTMKFPKKAKVINKKLTLNPSCPQCDPFYLDSGKCTPCIIIRR